MILRRLGNKKKLVKDILPHIPYHNAYVEAFFGTGSLFFYKTKSKYNIANDFDSDVANLFHVVMNQKEALKELYTMMPIHKDLFEYWKTNKETDPVKKALRFLFLSNHTYLGKMDCLNFKLRSNDKKAFLDNIDATFSKLQGVVFNNADFRDFFKQLSFTDTDYGKPSYEREKTFIYADPSYLDTNTTYEGRKWVAEDSYDLCVCLKESGCKTAYSEFNHPVILDLAKEFNLEVIYLKERRNLKNRKQEILLVNYESPAYGLFKVA